ncbi:MAG TPA: polysaccharide biosynthesis/export family protein [Verrucomicrobiae bacterium]
MLALIIRFVVLGFVSLEAMAQVPTPSPFTPINTQPAALVSATPPAPVAPAMAGNVPAAGLLNGYVPDATYKLRVGDTVSFQIMEDRIWNSQDVPRPLVVTDSGEVDVPYIGRMMAVDKTCKQLADDITVALEKDYYNKATVALSLNMANRILGRVYIWGQVHNQGPIEIQVNENLTAGQAILKAGGLADFANKNKVKVVRNTVDPNDPKHTVNLDMEQILEKGKTDQDVILRPGDLIIVPSRLFNF